MEKHRDEILDCFLSILLELVVHVVQVVHNLG